MFRKAPCTISLRLFQNKIASTELNERKRFRSSSETDVTLSPGSEHRKSKFEVSEEEWLSFLKYVKDPEAKQLIDTRRIENLSTRREWRIKEGANGPSSLLGVLEKRTGQSKRLCRARGGRRCCQQEQDYQTTTGSGTCFSSG